MAFVMELFMCWIEISIIQMTIFSGLICTLVTSNDATEVLLADKKTFFPVFHEVAGVIPTVVAEFVWVRSTSQCKLY